MKVVFRVDASLRIGTGHVMRCLTLADALKSNGTKCYFICRELSGNLISFIRERGYTVYILPHAESDIAGFIDKQEDHLAHSAWLGTSQQSDANQCHSILSNLQPDWLIVDHYALDIRWETAISDNCRRLMVIDDLADRKHHCDLLLDQTFGRNIEDYQSLVPDGCEILCGSQYALLRPEFAALRPYSLQRRKSFPQLQHLLITMGGVDKDNVTGQVLAALHHCQLPEQCKITVVMGATAPWLTNVSQLATDMPWPTTVKVNVSNMAQLMADSDLAIGAAGATSWERCCLGLPTIMLVLAENQRGIAKALKNSGAVFILDCFMLKVQPFIPRQHVESATLAVMSASASGISDGSGALRVIEYLK